MDNSTYTTLTRQTGLMSEMQSVANNIANASTTGFRKEGIVFSEHISAMGDASESLSMATARVRTTDDRQGALAQTGGQLDLAIEGDGFFLIETPQGERLTRAGHFTPSAEGDLVTADGYRVLDSGGSPVFIPPDARSISLSSDGTLSADGQPLTQIGLFLPINSNDLLRQNGVMFRAESGVTPTETASILQGFLEQSNVDPVSEISRMIEVQHAYELGQSFLDKEDERIRAVLQTLGR